MISAEDYLGLIAVEACGAFSLDLSLVEDRSRFREVLRCIGERPLSADDTLEFTGKTYSLGSTSLLPLLAPQHVDVERSALSSAIHSTRTEALALLPDLNRALIIEDETLGAFRAVAMAYDELVRTQIDEGVCREDPTTGDLEPTNGHGAPDSETRREHILDEIDQGPAVELNSAEREELGALATRLGRLARAGEGQESNSPCLDRLRAIAGEGKTLLAFHLLREFFQVSMEHEKRGKDWLDLVQEAGPPAASANAQRPTGRPRYKWTDWRVLDVLRECFSDEQGDHSHDLILKRVAAHLDLSRDRPLTVLVIGAGEGRLPQDLDRLTGGRTKIVATDHDPGNVMYAYAQYVRGGNRNIVANTPANVANLSMFGDGSFDLVISHGVLRYFVTLYGKQAASEVARVIRPGGVVLFQDALRPAWSYLTTAFGDYLQAAGLRTWVDKEEHRVKNLSITYKLIMHYEAPQLGPFHELLGEVVDRLVDEGLGANYLQVIASLTGTREEWVRLVGATRPIEDRASDHQRGLVDPSTSSGRT